MSEKFTPRTLAIVAVASLVTGFVVVFGSGMLWFRQGPGAGGSIPVATTVTGGGGTSTVGGTLGAGGTLGTPSHLAATDPSGPTDPGSGPVPMMAGGDAATDPSAGIPVMPGLTDDGGPGTPGTVTVSPGAISRCFDQTAPAVIPGVHCDALAALDQHMQTHAAQIAACARGHGHLAFVMDFRFSTSFVRAWGGPTSTIPSAGIVAACVRRVSAPLPLAQVAHAHDRYIVAYGIDW